MPLPPCDHDECPATGCKVRAPELGGANGSALFIPLKREYYERFRDGTKAVEFRPYGPRWNERTCATGRRVVLSLGYGKRHRMMGIVQSFRVADERERAEIPGWAACYGAEDRRPIACIGIYLDYDARVAGGFQQNVEMSNAVIGSQRQDRAT
jgi:hypothetical protein